MKERSSRFCKQCNAICEVETDVPNHVLHARIVVAGLGYCVCRAAYLDLSQVTENDQWVNGQAHRQREEEEARLVSMK